MYAALLTLSGLCPYFIGPAPKPADYAPPTLPALLAGSEWAGTWGREGTEDEGARLRGESLTLPMTPAATLRLVVVDEGGGRFHGAVGALPVLGVWRLDGDVLRLCWRAAAKGYPENFRAEGRQDVLTLRRPP